MGCSTRALNRRACWVTLLHPSGVASVPLQLGLGSPSLGRRGPRDMETDHMCDGVSMVFTCVMGLGFYLFTFFFHPGVQYSLSAYALKEKTWGNP